MTTIETIYQKSTVTRSDAATSVPIPTPTPTPTPSPSPTAATYTIPAILVSTNSLDTLCQPRSNIFNNNNNNSHHPTVHNTIHRSLSALPISSSTTHHHNPNLPLPHHPNHPTSHPNPPHHNQRLTLSFPIVLANYKANPSTPNLQSLFAEAQAAGVVISSPADLEGLISAGNGGGGAEGWGG